MKLFYWLRLMPYLELSLSDKYHSDKMAARSREDKWREALEIACSVFKIQSLYDEQEESLKKYFEGNHVYMESRLFISLCRSSPMLYVARAKERVLSWLFLL